MSWFDAIRFRARALTRRHLEQEFDDEVRFHLEELTSQYESRGLSNDEARAAARREFGISSTVKEDLRAARGLHLIDAFAQDVRHGVRQLLRNPGFSCAALLTIALGIGATTAVFTVVYNVLLRPLPYPEPERLVSLWTSAPDLGLPRAFVGAANYRDWVARNRSFESLALVRHIGNFNLTGSGEPERLLGARVTASLFTVLRTNPALGRPFSPEEEQIGREYVTILSDGVWARRFARDPAVIGRTVLLNGVPHQIVGVMPPSFAYPSRDFQLWVPLTVNPDDLVTRLGYNFLSVGRLRPDVTIEAAQADMDGIARQLAAEFPSTNKNGVLVQAMRGDLVRDVRRPLLLLLAGVASLLLIGCASLANLLIARAVSRSSELVLRAALGASRGRLLRQSLTELLPLLVAGGVAGVVLAELLLDAAIPLLPVTMPRVEGIGLRLPILLFATAALALTGVATGIWPALQAARWDVASALRESLRGASSTLRGSRVRDLLVVAQIAIALLLSVCAALLARSFSNVARSDAGFDVQGVVTLHLAIPRAKYGDDPQVAEICGRILERVSLVPGVGSAGMVNRLPLAGGASVGLLQLERSALTNERAESVDWRTVTPGYFAAMRIPLREGRVFAESDNENAQPVGIIDERLARAAWPNQSAVGRRFRIPIGNAPWVTIVGVVGHIRHDDMSVEGRPQVYWNYRQRAQDRMALVVRAQQEPSSLIRPIIAEIRAVDPDQPVYDVRTMKEVVERSLGQQWLTTAVLSAFAVVSLLMAAIGVYGVVSCGVRQRTHEFSVRMALGAAKWDVLMLVLRRGALLVASGVAIGFLASLAATQTLRTLLHDVSATDALSFASATAILAVAALLATIIPARRAVRTQPAAALRGE